MWESPLQNREPAAYRCLGLLLSSHRGILLLVGTAILIVSRVYLRAGEDAGAHQQDIRLVQEPVLEGGDGVDPSGAPVLRQDHLRQRYCREFF